MREKVVSMCLQSDNKVRGKFTIAGKLIMAIGLLGVYGCLAVGPDYVRPEVDLPEKWGTEMTRGLDSKSAKPETLAQWWKALDDPLLSELMEKSVAGNLDLQTAMARVKESRARRGVSKSRLYPQIEANAAYTKTRLKENGLFEDYGIDVDPGLFGIDMDRDTEVYSAGFDAVWEIDIFGGVRRSAEAATADLTATEESYNGVLVSLLAETARNYVEVRTMQKRLEVARTNERLLVETLHITRSRFKAGLTDEFAVKSTQADLAGTRARIPIWQAWLQASKNRLSVLIGENPGALDAMLAKTLPVPVPPGDIAVGVPTDALRNRPDVRQAERKVAAQTARIGVAKSELYPKFSLFGTLGYSSSESDDLFDSGNLTSSYGPSMKWGIFRGGAVFQNIKIQEARQEQALKQYQSTVLKALEEAEDALANYVYEQSRRDQLITASESSAQAFKLARAQYQAGRVDFNSVLISQRAMLNYEDQLVQSEGAVTTNFVRLYKSLGGGWTPQAEIAGITSGKTKTGDR